MTVGLLAVFTTASVVGGLALGRSSGLVAAVATAVTAAALGSLPQPISAVGRPALLPDARRRPRPRSTSFGDGPIRHARPEQLEEMLRAALRDPSLRIGYVVPHSGELVDSGGRRLRPATTGRRRSSSTAADRCPGVGQETSRELLREIASASALLVEVVRLRAEVGLVLQDVESSRARLLHVGYQERRRLERDLHDGAQQRLVSLGMAIRVAQRHLGDGTVDVDGSARPDRGRAGEGGG